MLPNFGFIFYHLWLFHILLLKNWKINRRFRKIDVKWKYWKAIIIKMIKCVSLQRKCLHHSHRHENWFFLEFIGTFSTSYSASDEIWNRQLSIDSRQYSKRFKTKIQQVDWQTVFDSNFSFSSSQAIKWNLMAMNEAAGKVSKSIISNLTFLLKKQWIRLFLPRTKNNDSNSPTISIFHVFYFERTYLFIWAHFHKHLDRK